MTWHRSALAAFDVESTGMDVESDRIVTASVVLIRPGQPNGVRSHLIAVDVDIPAEATAVHGITTERARAEGKPAVEVLDAVASDLADACRSGVPIVGMNCVFDLTMLDRELARHGLPSLEQRIGGPVAPVLDVLVLDRAVDRYRRGKRTLTDLCAFYGVQHDGAHDSAADAVAAARVAYKIGWRAHAPSEQLVEVYQDRRYPSEVAASVRRLADLTLDALHRLQTGWFAGQAESLAVWWRQQANELEHQAETSPDRDALLEEAEDLRRRADTINTVWPLIPAPAEDLAVAA